MPIYRGDGGSGDATTDAYASQVALDAQKAEEQAGIATTKASEASSSATAAASSATSAATSATNAATSETNAGTSETNAATSATNAATSASSASTSATNAASSATTATTQASNASTSATNAATSEINAATSASNASTSETNAATSATNAATSATNASTAQTAAETAQTAAEAAQTAAEAAQQAIDGFFLGAQASNPTVDLNGNAVTAGDWYFNTTDNTTRIYDGSAWNTVNPDLIGDTTPQLGGTLDANGNNIDMGVNVITDTKVGQWDTAYGWGDHSTAGYLTSYTEADPVFSAHTTSNITDGAGRLQNDGLGNWSYDNATYLTSYTETDTLDSVTGRGATTTNAVTVGNLTSTGIDDNATSTAITIDSSQNVGLGTSNPSSRLQITAGGQNNSPTLGAIDSNAPLYVTNSDDAYGLVTGVNAADGRVWMQAQRTDGTATAYNITLNEAGGDVGIGTTPGGSRLNVQGSTTTSAAYALYAKDSGGSLLFHVRNDGVVNTGAQTNSPYNLTTASAANVHVTSAGTLYRSTSSARYKRNIQDMTYGVADVMNLRAVTFEQKNEYPSNTYAGFIAEEVHDAGLTEFVEYNDAGQPDAVHYANMVSLLTKAIQEQQATIASLTARIEQLEAN